HPGTFGVRVCIDYLCGMESADLAACLYLQAKPPPELGIIGESRIDQLDRDRAPGPRPAEEYLAHPARPKATGQNIVPDSPWVSWPKGIHATPAPQGNSGRNEPAPNPMIPGNRPPGKKIQPLGIRGHPLPGGGHA